MGESGTTSTNAGGWWEYMSYMRAAASCGACSDAVAKHGDMARECAIWRRWKLQALTKGFEIDRIQWVE